MYLSVNQALNIWDKLVSAYYGHGSFGDNVVVIYLYECTEHSPTVGGQQISRARQTLRDLMNRFLEEYSDARLSTEGGDPVDLDDGQGWYIMVTKTEDEIENGDDD